MWVIVLGYAHSEEPANLRLLARIKGIRKQDHISVSVYKEEDPWDESSCLRKVGKIDPGAGVVVRKAVSRLAELLEGVTKERLLDPGEQTMSGGFPSLVLFSHGVPCCAMTITWGERHQVVVDSVAFLQPNTEIRGFKLSDDGGSLLLESQPLWDCIYVLLKTGAPGDMKAVEDHYRAQEERRRGLGVTP